MAFTDDDPLEQDMGVRCEDMTPNQLIRYVVTYQRAFDRDIKVEGPRETNAFKGLQAIYGQRDAGLIVKWAFYKHRGQWRGDCVTPTWFSKGRRWWLDIMHLEVQEALRHSGPAHYEGATLGGPGLLDL